jgi:hypothetical protein
MIIGFLLRLTEKRLPNASRCRGIPVVSMRSCPRVRVEHLRKIEHSALMISDQSGHAVAGGSVIPEPLTPYPYIATAFFTVIFVNTPLNPYLATGFKTRKCYLNAILRRFRSKRARTNKPNVRSGGFCLGSVEVCRELSSICRAILSSSCRVAVE